MALPILFFTFNIECVSDIASITRFSPKIVAAILTQSSEIASIDLSSQKTAFAMAIYDCTDFIFTIINFSNVFSVFQIREISAAPVQHTSVKVLYTVLEIVWTIATKFIIDCFIYHSKRKQANNLMRPCEGFLESSFSPACREKWGVLALNIIAFLCSRRHLQGSRDWTGARRQQ